MKSIDRNTEPLSSRQPAGLYLFVKRSLDVFASAIALILLSPIMVVVAAAIRITMGRPVLFRQMRAGLNDRSFMCLKFRTMRDTRDAKGELLSDEERLTRVGSILRRTSLDELPQLWNVLRGDMSFIGPRPLLPSYLSLYTATERRRQLVRPGITGWAQIHGRSALPFDERLAMDAWYVDHFSWKLDLRILITTPWVVLTQRGYTLGCVSLHDLRRPDETYTAESGQNH